MGTTRRAHAWRRSPADDRGVIAVEFALLAPLLFMLLFGMIQFGRAYNAKVELTAAVREGARVLALNSGDPVSTTTAAAPGLDITAITVTTSGSPCTTGTQASVTASYPFDLNIPFWQNAVVTISAKGVMRCNG